MSQQHLANARLFLMALAILMLTAACGKDSPSPANGTPTDQSAEAAPTEAPANGTPADQSAEAAPTDAPVVETPDTQAVAAMLAKWTGDLDGMIERRMIRVLTTYSKTTFFIDRGQQLGLVPDAFRLFEDDLNKRLNNKNCEYSRVRTGCARRSHSGAARGSRRHRGRRQVDYGVA